MHFHNDSICVHHSHFQFIHDLEMERFTTKCLLLNTPKCNLNCQHQSLSSIYNTFKCYLFNRHLLRGPKVTSLC